jgi:hypothetical protein
VACQDGIPGVHTSQESPPAGRLGLHWGTGDPGQVAEEDEPGRVDPDTDAADQIAEVRVGPEGAGIVMFRNAALPRPKVGRSGRTRPGLPSGSSHQTLPRQQLHLSPCRAAKQAPVQPCNSRGLGGGNGAEVGMAATGAATASTGSTAIARAMCPARWRWSAAGVVAKAEAIARSGVSVISAASISPRSG